MLQWVNLNLKKKLKWMLLLHKTLWIGSSAGINQYSSNELIIYNEINEAIPTAGLILYVNSHTLPVLMLSKYQENWSPNAICFLWESFFSIFRFFLLIFCPQNGTETINGFRDCFWFCGGFLVIFSSLSKMSFQNQIHFRKTWFYFINF